MGHAGTLDPLASGLLIVGVDAGTKKMPEFLKLPKTYIADILIGERRNTGDMDGEVIEKKIPISLSESVIKTAAEKIVGSHELPVPLYSAIKVSGSPLYSYARKGKKVTVPVKKMVITSAEILTIERHDGYCLARMKLNVESGTYIRSIAEEFGRLLGYPATLQDLRRTQIGPFTIEEAQKI